MHGHGLNVNCVFMFGLLRQIVYVQIHLVHCTIFFEEVDVLTSGERRSARRERRELKRAEKRKQSIGKYDNYDNIISMKSLLYAAKLSRKTVSWKASVQRYFMSLLRNLIETHDKLVKQAPVTMGFISFTISERGKTRHIRSVHFKERVVQRSLCDNALIPVLSRTLIYDNGASVKDKGIHFAFNRLKRHLHEYYHRNKTNEGWILLIDYHGYFDSIRHDKVMQIVDNAFSDKKIVSLTKQFVDAFGDKSLGIGSQVSQILAITYPNRIDHYFAEVMHIKEFARYNDDCYYISRDKVELEECLRKHREMANELGIELNEKKTMIIPLKSFTFMKARVFLTDTGKVIMKPCRKSITRMRRRLKKLKAMLDNGEIDFKTVHDGYESWRGYINYFDAHKTIREMDKLFYDIFGVWPMRKRDAKKDEVPINVCLYARPMGNGYCEL